MKTLCLILIAAICASCSQIAVKPVRVTYTDPTTGIKITEDVGDGKVGVTVDLSDIKINGKNIVVEDAK